MKITSALLLSFSLLFLNQIARGQTPASAAQTQKLFAVQFKTGPKWNADKPPQEQAFFTEHSANLRALRESGVLLLGARYGDIGLIVLNADTIATAHSYIDRDPSVKAGTFVYEINDFSVFYGGTLPPLKSK